MLSSSGGAYDQFRSNWQVCRHPNIDLYFIEYSNSIDKDVIIDRSILFKGVDSLVPGCLTKTVKSLQMFDLSQYDYIVRTNLSSVIHFQRLVDYLSTQPTERYYAGKYIPHSLSALERRYIANIGLTTNPRLTLCSGALFIMSPDVAQIVANDQHYRNTPMIDDVHIAVIIQHTCENLIMRPLNRLDNEAVNVYDLNYYHYRFNSINRKVDVVRHLEALKLIYEDKSVQPLSSLSYESLTVPSAVQQIDTQLAAHRDDSDHIEFAERCTIPCHSAIIFDSLHQVIDRSMFWAVLDMMSKVDGIRSLIYHSVEIPTDIKLLAHCARALDVDFQYIRRIDETVEQCLSTDLPEVDLVIAAGVQSWEFKQLKVKARKICIVQHAEDN